jgi:hypothetical protein
MRGQAHCGGIANSLDKVLKAIGLESRIVHVEDGRRIHTLVEYFDPHLRQWLLADAQHNVIGQDGETISGWDAVHGPGGPSVPEAWRGYTRLYVYRRFGGYHRVTGKNRHVYYP